jgi:HK97 family phage major capsid protein
VVGGTNGLAPTWAHITQLEREVAIDNADLGGLAYITNPKVRYKLKNTYRNATYGEIPIWGDNREQPLNGYSTFVTNQVSAALTKGSSSGTASAIFFGNWNELLIGLWSGIDVLIDPYTNSATGATRIVAMQDVDVAVRHAESFAAMLDALTA